MTTAAGVHSDNDVLAAEIARLEVELAAAGAFVPSKDKEQQQNANNSNALQRMASQRDYVVVRNDSNNNHNALDGGTSNDDELSYDEITVNTNDEMMGILDGIEDADDASTTMNNRVISSASTKAVASPIASIKPKQKQYKMATKSSPGKYASNATNETATSATDLSKYRQMLQIGLPDAAVRHTMTQNGVEPNLLFTASPNSGNKTFSSPGTTKKASPMRKPSPKKATATAQLTSINLQQLQLPKSNSTSADDAAAKLQAEIEKMEAEIKAATTAAKKKGPPKKKPLGAKKRGANKKQQTAVSDAERQLQLEIERMEAEIQQSSPVKKSKPTLLKTITTEKQKQLQRPKIVSPPTSPQQMSSTKNQYLYTSPQRTPTTATASKVILKAAAAMTPKQHVAPTPPPKQNTPKQSAQAPTSSDTDSVYGKYHQMMKIGLPEGAILNAMDRDGVDPSGMSFTKKSPAARPTPPSPTKNRTKNADAPQVPVDPVYAKYQQMLKIGLPEGAIVNAMERDDVDVAGMSFTPSAKKPSKNTAVHSGNATATRAIATPPAPKVLPKSEQIPAYAKYYQMIKIGLPDGAVRVAIERDGIDPCMVLGGDPLQPKPKAKPKAAPAPVQKADSNDPKYSKYFTMLEIGLPDGTVLNAMDRDGADPAAVFGTNVPVSHMRDGPPSKPRTEAERLAAEIKRMEKTIANETAAAQHTEAASMFNLLGSIADAATHREQRIEENDGELYMQEIVPEVEAQHITPQLSTSMAETISSMAKARDKRLENGGEKRMRKVEILEKSEYKQQFSSIVDDAAAMGRLTRLDEQAVEATAIEKTPEQEWRSNGLMAIQWRSNHMSVIHDAARAGKAQKMEERITSNCDELEDPNPDNTGKKLSPRMQQLMKLNTQAGEGQQKVDKLVMGRKEQSPKEDSLLIRPMYEYAGGDTQLPRKAPPRIDPQQNAERLSKMTREAIKDGRPMVDISVGVAERAWERRARLDRPGGMPKIKEVCPCPYCHNASPFQTFAYRELDRKRREHHLKVQQGEHFDPEPMKEEVVEEVVVEPVETEAQAIERKRLERKQAREEKRKLQQVAAETSQQATPAMTTTTTTVTPLEKVEDMEQFAVPSPVDAGCKCIIM